MKKVFKYNIKSARYLEDYKVFIEFTDSTTVEADFRDFIFSSLQPMTNQFKDKNLFAQVRVLNGALDWFYEMDFDPIDLYKDQIPGVMIRQLHSV